jgi:hypothetical protein
MRTSQRMSGRMRSVIGLPFFGSGGFSGFLIASAMYARSALFVNSTVPSSALGAIERHHHSVMGRTTRTRSAKSSLAATVDWLYTTLARPGFSFTASFFHSALPRAFLIRSTSSWRTLPAKVSRSGVRRSFTGSNASNSSSSWASVRTPAKRSQTSGRTGESCVKRRTLPFPSMSCSIASRLSGGRSD